jgi:hypothetical protein
MFVIYVRNEVFTVVTVKNAIFWDVLRRVIQLLVTANVPSSSSILVTLMMEVIHSSEPSVLTGATQHYVPEDGIRLI